MLIFPAIDLLDGKAVRLKQGRYEDPTVYSDDPAAVATAFRAKTDRLHVVDLAGAKAGAPVQTDTIRAIARANAGGVLQVGGGVRTPAALADVDAVLSGFSFLPAESASGDPDVWVPDSWTEVERPMRGVRAFVVADRRLSRPAMTIAVAPESTAQSSRFPIFVYFDKRLPGAALVIQGSVQPLP